MYKLAFMEIKNFCSVKATINRRTATCKGVKLDGSLAPHTKNRLGTGGAPERTAETVKAPQRKPRRRVPGRPPRQRLCGFAKATGAEANPGGHAGARASVQPSGGGRPPGQEGRRQVAPLSGSSHPKDGKNSRRSRARGLKAAGAAERTCVRSRQTVAACACVGRGPASRRSKPRGVSVTSHLSEWLLSQNERRRGEGGTPRARLAGHGFVRPVDPSWCVLPKVRRRSRPTIQPSRSWVFIQRR